MTVSREIYMSIFIFIFTFPQFQYMTRSFKDLLDRIIELTYKKLYYLGLINRGVDGGDLILGLFVYFDSNDMNSHNMKRQ